MARKTEEKQKPVKVKRDENRPTRRPKRPGSVKIKSGWGKALDFERACILRAARAGR